MLSTPRWTRKPLEGGLTLDLPAAVPNGSPPVILTDNLKHDGYCVLNTASKRAIMHM
jgi:hypothetical protein